MSKLASDWFELTLEVSLKSCVLLGVAALGLLIFRVRNTNVKHAVWLGVLLGTLVLPCLTLVLPNILFTVPIQAYPFDRNEESVVSGTVVESKAAHVATMPSSNPAKSPFAADGPQKYSDEDAVKGVQSIESRSLTLAAFPEPRPTSDAIVEGQYETISPTNAEFEDVGSSSVSSSFAPVPSSWPVFVATIWICVTVVFTSRLLLAVIVTRRLVHTADMIPSAVLDSLTGGACYDRVDIRESADVLVPLTAGVLRPSVLLPCGWRTWSTRKLRDVLAHEKAHIRRRDCLTSLLAEIATCYYWFLPVSWWLRRQLSILAEEACDDAAIGPADNRAAYARHLLEVAGDLSGHSGHIVYCGLSMARKSHVEDRINTILDSSRPRSRQLTWFVVLLIVCITLPVIGLAAAIKPATAHEVSESHSDVPITIKDDSDQFEIAHFAEDVVALNDEGRNQPRRTAGSQAAGDSDTAEHAVPSHEDVRLTVTGRVFLADGSPAAHSLVSVVRDRNIGDIESRGFSVRTDSKGRFELKHLFGQNCSLQARTADWRQQATVRIPCALARERLRKPIELRLQRAREQLVTVQAGGQPVEGVHVVAFDRVNYKAEGRSGPDGTAKLWLPAGLSLKHLVAWHQELGIAGGLYDAKNHPSGPVELSLATPGPHTIRVIDEAGRPVPRLKISVGVAMSTWLPTFEIDAANVQTGANGKVTIRWIPRDVESVHVSLLDRTWKIDEKDADHTKSGTTTIKIRRMRAVSGRLVLPNNESPEGILISGYGYGLGEYGSTTLARCDRDGTFMIRAAPNHGYALNIEDSKWVSDGWTGVILQDVNADPAQVSIPAYRGTPLRVRVTRGPKHEPVPGAYISGSASRTFKWKDSRGKSHNASGGARSSQRTDADGIAYFTIVKGNYSLSLYSGAWREEKSIESTSGEPLELEFHRPWLGKRKLTGLLTSKNQPWKPTSKTTIQARSATGLKPILAGDTKISPDGSYNVSADEENVFVLIMDSKTRTNAFREIGPAQSQVNLEMSPMGMYGGTVVDSAGRPLPNRSVRLVLYNGARYFVMSDVVVAETKCDDRGRFKFDSAPSGTPMIVLVGEPSKSEGESFPVRFPLHSVHLEPGEERQNAKIKVKTGSRKGARLLPSNAKSSSVINVSHQKKLKKDVKSNPHEHHPFVKRLNSLVRDARLNELRVLIVVKGDNSKSLAQTVQDLLDSDEQEEILRYLPYVVNVEEMPHSLPKPWRLTWAAPKNGELTLIALGSDGRQIDASRVPMDEGSLAVDSAAQFIKKHAPPVRDARLLLAAARKEAGRTGRRVWVVIGGSRCGPCFRLTRWLEEQHELVEKDYVVLKLNADLVQNLEEILKNLKRPEMSGVPWMAISNAEGELLVTGDSPLGNIGFPSSVEDKRHFRKMLDRTAQRLDPEQLDQLIGSLAP